MVRRSFYPFIFLFRNLGDLTTHAQLGGTQSLQKPDLLVSQVRMPEVDNQHNSSLATFVVRLMAESVIPHDSFILRVRNNLIRNVQSGTLQAQQRQMAPKHFVGGPAMRFDMGPRCKGREERV
jgi:hypothetical protein